MEGCLRAIGISKKFGEIQALMDTTVSIDESEIVGIVGPNGAGKTTLLNVINGVVKPDKGKVIFRDEDVTGLTAAQVAQRGIARTFQVPRIFPSFTSFENILVALNSPRSKKVHSKALEKGLELMEEVGIERDSIYAYMEAKSLPGGFMKRVELARALALNPYVILMDELFSGLAKPEIDSLSPLIKEIRDNYHVTIVMVEHMIKELLQLADRIIILNVGRLIFDGNPKQAIEDDAVRAAYLGED